MPPDTLASNLSEYHWTLHSYRYELADFEAKEFEDLSTYPRAKFHRTWLRKVLLAASSWKPADLLP